MADLEMADEGPSFEDERGGPPGQSEVDQEVATREPYLRRVLADFEAGRLEAYEYTRRVLAINAASSTEEMSAIVQWPTDRSPGDGGVVVLRGLDAVDLALLRSARASAPRSPTIRYVTLAVVFVMFAVLIGVGMWLATHVHAASLAPGATAVAASRWHPWVD